MTRPSLIPSIPGLESALRRGASIVTATERQAREIRYHAAANGIDDSPCQSQTEFWLSQWRIAQDEGLIDRALLSAEGLRVVARACALKPGWREHVDGFLDARQLCHLARVSFDDAMFGANEATRTFAAWARVLSERLARTGFCSAAEIPPLIRRRHTSLPSIKSYGFRPSQCNANTLVDAVAAIALPTGAPAEHRHAAFASPDDELRATAEWARMMLDRVDTVAVVVDELGANTARVIQRFHAAFSDVDLDRTVSFSGGVSLAQERPVGHALALLTMMIEGIDDDLRRSLLVSPFLRPARALRELARKHLAFVPLGGVRPAGLEFFTTDPERDDLARQLERCLEVWGWPGHGLDSREFQAVAQFEALIKDVARALRLAGRPSWREVLAMLNDQTNRTVFSPQAHHAPIQVLGRAESFGLSFDAIWVTGCQRGNWPLPPRRNPFVPSDLYRNDLVPGGSMANCQADAAELQSWWQRSAGLLVQSVVVEEGATFETSRSPMIPASSQVMDDASVIASGHPLARTREPAFLHFEDVAPDPISPDASAVGGGTALLTDQSVCAFRGWAIHRLGIRAPALQSVLPTKAELGTVLHEVLALATEAMPNREMLSDARREDFARLISSVVDAQGWPAEFARIETERLAGVVALWRELEVSRPDFEVVAVEHDIEVELGGIRVGARIDRIDQSQDARIVIDYKSGRSSINDWRPPRLDAPQVPLYFLHQQADAAAYLQLDEGARLTGVADPGVETKGLRSADRLGFGSIHELTDAWREALDTLVLEIIKGVNTPMPSTRACNQCHLAPMCRQFSRG